jgi:hypothetical protein
MKHNKPEVAARTLEILRRQRDFSTSLTSSPLLSIREENCKNCEGPFSPAWTPVWGQPWNSGLLLLELKLLWLSPL